MNKPEGRRAMRRRMERSKVKRLGMMGAISATALAMGLTPALANAANSETYFIGFPEWLPIGEGSTLPSDPVAINNAIVGAKDTDPLIAWGLGPVDLRPTFVKWYTPVNPLDPTDPNQEQYYTPGEWGQTGSHTVSYTGPNPLYQPAYDAAYDLAYNYDVAYGVAYAQISAAAYDSAYARLSRGCSGWTARLCQAKAAVDAAAEAKRIADAQAPAAARAEATRLALAAALAAVANIPKTVEFSEEIPEYGWTEDGFWSTTTSGQWVASPEDVADLPTAGQLAYLAQAVQNGDLSALAPVLNWTAYLTNVNLIAYGDGAIAAGQAYQAYLDSVRGETHEGYDAFVIGDPETGPRKIRITFGDGVIQVHQTDTTNNPLEIPLPGDLEFPDAPQVGWESVQDGGVVDLTVLSLVLARNPGRANGGLYARFAPLYEELTGVNPISPDRQDVLPEGVDPELITKLLTGNADGITMDELGNIQAVIDSVDGKPIVVTLKADVGWQYDLLSDAPATANPFAWANSVASAVLLTNLLTGTDFQNLGDGGYIGPDGTIYYTLPVEELPLLAPLRMPSQAAGLALGDAYANAALADALEPAMKILVNLGYTDVVRQEDGTYVRTLDQFGENALFGTPTLTREQWALVPGDLVAALGAGFGDELSDVLIRTKDQLVKNLALNLTPEQDAALENTLVTAGGVLKTVSRDAGDVVSAGLGAVDARVPDQPQVTQEQLAAVQRATGRELAEARDDAGQVAGQVDSAVRDARESAAERRSVLRDSIRKAGDNLQRAGEQVGENIRNAVDRDREADASDNGSATDDADNNDAADKASDNASGSDASDGTDAQ
ncbi:PE-PPE domain-containing protein [Mycobacterium sp. PS03-16]|nr:PE-PPE domain-containing protein [Mycobacterium sp. PS03-16]